MRPLYKVTKKSPNFETVFVYTYSLTYVPLLYPFLSKINRPDLRYITTY